MASTRQTARPVYLGSGERYERQTAAATAALFGFREDGYRAAIVLALIFEGVAVLCLSGFAAAVARRSG